MLAPTVAVTVLPVPPVRALVVPAFSVLAPVVAPMVLPVPPVKVLVVAAVRVLLLPVTKLVEVPTWPMVLVDACVVPTVLLAPFSEELPLTLKLPNAPFCPVTAAPESVSVTVVVSWVDPLVLPPPTNAEELLLTVKPFWTLP